MKKALHFLFFVMLFLPVTAFGAGYGQAYLPHFFAYFSGAPEWENQETVICLSNIANETVAVQVTLFNSATGLIMQDGDDSVTTGDLQGSGGLTGWDDNPTDASVAFSIAPQKTAYIVLRPNTPKNGYGIIEWESTSRHTPAALLGFAYKFSIGENIVAGIPHLDGGYGIPINAGQPF